MSSSWIRSLVSRPVARTIQKPAPSRNSPLRVRFDILEDRLAPATLTWVGDVNTSWNTNSSGNTNWFNTTTATDNALPASGDTLVFAGAAVGTLNNDTTAGNSYVLQFTAGGYTITGNSITLDVAGNDVTSSTGTNAVNVPMTLAADSTFSVAAGTVSSNAIIGGANLTKLGAGALALTGGNTYSGTTTLGGGVLSANASAALGNGTATNTLIFSGGTLQASGAIASPAARGVTITSTAIIDTNAQTITISGIITGSGGLTKNNTGTLSLGGNNDFTGITTINRGTVTLTSANALGATGAGNQTIVNGADGTTSTTLSLNPAAAINVPEALVLTATAAGRVSLVNTAQNNILSGAMDVTSTGTLLQFTSNGGAMTITGDISGTMTGGSILLVRGGSTSTLNHLQGSVNIVGTLAKTDAGLWLVGAASKTYSWTTTQVSVGTLRLNVANILPAAGAIILGQNDNNSATLDLNNLSQTTAGITYNFAGTSTTSVGTLSTGTGTLTLNGAVTYNTVNTYTGTGGVLSGNLNLGGATQTLTINDSTGTTSEFTISALVSNGGISKAGGGRLSLTGAAANTFVGDLAVTAGEVRLAKTAGLNAFGGNTTVSAGVLSLGAANQIPDTSTIIVSGTGRMNFGNVNETFATYTGSGTGGVGDAAAIGNGTGGAIVVTGTTSLNMTANTNVIVNTGGSYTTTGLTITGATNALFKDGGGTLALLGIITYTGSTTVNAGTLAINSNLPDNAANPDVIVAAGATLGGSGTISGTVSALGVINPGLGAATAQFGTGSVTTAASTDLAFDINGLTVGSQYDRLNVTGNTTLTGVDLVLGGSFVLGPGQQFLILNVTGTRTGFFNGLPEGTAIPFNGNTLFISYLGGDGNDVVLSTPAATMVTGTGGNDTLIVRRQAAGATDNDIEYNLNGAGFVPINAVALAFDGQGGDDTMTVDFVNGDTVPVLGISFAAGASGPGDKLIVKGNGGGLSAAYTPSATVTGNGTIAIGGAGNGLIDFTSLEALDITGTTSASFVAPATTSLLTIVNGLDFATGATGALRLSGTSNAVAFTTVAFYNNSSLTIDTATNGGTGSDTVTITSADTGHGNSVLTINTGGGADVVALNGNVITDGNLTFTAVENIVLGASVTLDTEQLNDNNAGAINFGGAAISANAVGWDLTLNTSVAAGSFNGGAVTLGAFSNAVGGQFVNDFTINTAPSGAGTAGLITLTANITLDESGTADPADFIISNAAKVAIAATLTVNTDNGNNGLPTVASVINWATSNIYAAAPGLTLTLSGRNATATPAPVTNFSIGLVDDNAGANNFLGGLTFGGGNSVMNASTVTLNGNIFLNGNFATGNSTTTFGAPLFTTSVTIDTAQGAATTGGSITFTNSASPSAAGINADVVLDTSAVTTGGAISFFNLNPGATANGLNDVTLNTNGGSTDGVISITGSINLDNNGTDTGDFTVVGGGQVRFNGGAHTIDTETGNNGNGGSINFGTSQVSGSGTNADLALNTLTTLAGGSGGAVTLAAFGNGGGQFINDLAINVSPGAGGTPGLLTLTGSITLDNNADAPDFTLTGNGKVAIGATLTVDTESGSNAVPGFVNWGTSNIYATGPGFGLTINTDSNSATPADVTFGLVNDNAGANNFLGSLNINTAGGSGGSGRINMSANIFVDGDITLARRPNPLTSIVIDSEQGNNGPAGTITLSGALSSSVAGVDVTLDASVSGAFAGGNVLLPETAVDSSHGFYINDLIVNTAGGASNGTTTVRCNITLNDNAGDAGSFTVLGGGRILFDGSRTIDTENGDNGPAGAIDFGASLASATAAGFDIALNTSSITAGPAGAIVVGGFDGAGGAFVNDLTLTATGPNNATYGNVTLNGAVTLATNAADLGDFAITGSALAVNQAVTTTGNINWNARQAVSLPAAAVVSAGGSTIAVLANQDGAGAEGLTMAAGSSLATTNESATALAITVNTATGTGAAAIGGLSAGTATGVVTVLASAITDANAAAANITAASVRLVAAGGIGAADALETAITNLAASSTANAIQIANTGNLIIATVGATSGVASAGGDINLGGGSLTVNQPLNSGAGDMRLALTGGVTQAAAGAIIADELGIQAGGTVDLNDASPLLNNVATLGIVTSSGDIFYRDATTLAFANVAAGGSAGFTGASGIDTNGGNIDVRIALGGGTLTIPAGVTVDSGPGTGGDLTQGSAVIVNGTINLGAGDIFLLGGLAVDIILSASQTFISGGNVTYLSTRDIIVQPGVIIDVQSGGSLSLQAGFDNPAAVGAGGVWVQSGAAVKTSGFGTGTLTIQGKDLWATPNSTPGPNDDSVRIDGAASSTGSLSIGFTNDSVADPAYPVTAYLNTATPLAAALGGVSVNLPSRLGAHTTVSAGTGDVAFASTIDGGFNLTATASGDIAVGGAIGAAARVANVSFTAGSDVDTLGIATLGGNSISVTNGGGGTINGAVTEAAPATTFTKNGPGSITFTGAANNYTGATTVNDGTLVLAKAAGVTSIAGSLVIGDGNNNSQPANVKTAIVRVAASEQIINTAAISFTGGDGRLFVSAGVVETIPAPTTFGTGDVKIAGQLNTTTAYAQDGGATTLAGGTLRVGGTGTLDSSLAAGATLQGSGTILTNILTSNGTIDPSSGVTDADFGNASPGTLFIRGNLQMTASSVTNLDVGTSGSDQLNVGINTALALPAGSYTDLSNYDLDPYLRGDAASVTEPTRRGINDVTNINGVVRFNGTLNVRPTVTSGPIANDTTFPNAMNFVWRTLDLPVGNLNPRAGTLASIPSDFTTRNSRDVSGAILSSGTRYDPRFMGSAGQFNAIGQSVVVVGSGGIAVLAAPAYVLGQAKALTLTSLTADATLSSLVKVTHQVWNASKDSHTRVTLTVTNTGPAIAGPFYVEVLTVPAGTKLFNAAGKRPSTGRAYLVVPVASLAAGAATGVEVDLLTPLSLPKNATITTQIVVGGMP